MRLAGRAAPRRGHGDDPFPFAMRVLDFRRVKGLVKFPQLLAQGGLSQQVDSFSKQATGFGVWTLISWVQIPALIRSLLDTD